MLAERVLFHFFLWTYLFVQGIFTYILFYHHRFFVKAYSTQLNCEKRIFERDTLRFQMKQEYLEKERTDLGIYNIWRGWVIFIPLNIVFAVFLFAKYPTEVDSAFYYILMLLSIYQAYTQIKYLTEEFGYPPFYSLTGYINGNVQNYTQYYTQDYGDIYEAIESKISACHDPNAEYSCWDLLPSILRENLIKRYIIVHTSTNAYQAIDYFETAMKEKKYDHIIAYMDLTMKSDDLDQLGLSEHPYRNIESKDLVNYMKSIFKKALIPIILPWIIGLYLFVFHGWFGNLKVQKK